jgi:hypothetical protein
LLVFTGKETLEGEEAGKDKKPGMLVALCYILYENETEFRCTPGTVCFLS